ncbi:hypothetical protein [Thalassovita mediterranea]|uniref:Outer membrane protein beta-barrel domain-containing protein n=1 Tax=Thalassovita mediterranea TaxID=340021 RepID=A0A0P1H6G5_9RHOB|nr:hypothetical protein [Thalassovita mediterranea]CUH85400.1 hypothetical protein TM5383_02633 [Thalassovita mediterranea]SIS35465.1 hypothetical protein SAMN05421685_11611 [Thalassovita mediterranea]
MTKHSIISRGIMALGLCTVFCLPSAATAQSLETGDHIVTLHFSTLDRKDQDVTRDADTMMLSYGYQYAPKLRLLAFLGQIKTDNAFGADTQSTRTPTYGIGAQYQIGRGGTLTGTVIRGSISEDFTSGGTTTTGDGDTTTLTLQFDQVVPLSQRTFLKGSAAASHSKTDFDGPSFSNDLTIKRHTVGLEAFHLVGDSWMVSAGLSRTWSDTIITITDAKHLNRARLSATYRFNEDFGATLAWTQALGAEDTHQRLDLSLTHRF